MNVIEVEITSNDPTATALLAAATPWIEKLVSHRHLINPEFFKDGDPTQLATKMRRHLLPKGFKKYDQPKDVSQE